MVKQRAYGNGFNEKEMRAAWGTLHTCLKTCLLLLAPITPFITEKIWREIYSDDSIHVQELPKPEWDSTLQQHTEKIIDFNSRIWNLKRQKGLSLKDPISFVIPSELSSFERDLNAMHNLKQN